MLILNDTRDLSIPHEPGQHITVAVMGWRKKRDLLKASGRLTLQESVASIRDFPPELMAEIRSRATETATPAPAADATPDPMAGVDRDLLFQVSVVSWSYTNADGSPVPVTPEALDDLDDATADWLEAEIKAIYAAPQGKGSNG